jgi:hypothetical protein
MSSHNERMFLLNRCLEQVGEIIEQFRQDGVLHAAYASDRQCSVEELRADLSHVLTVILHQRAGGVREGGPEGT